MENNPNTPSEALVSKDRSQQQVFMDVENDNSNITPANIMTHPTLGKEYNNLLKLLNKKNRVEGTCALLKKCILNQVIPRSFNNANTDLYEQFCDNSKRRWNATTFLRIELSLEHHLKSLENLKKAYETAKTTLSVKLKSQK